MSDHRPITPLSRARPPFFAGVDVGGTNIKLGLVDDEGRTVAFESTPTHVEQGPQKAVERMDETLRRMAAASALGMEKIAAVGLATPGTMDVPRGMLLEPPNLPGWENFPIRDRFAELCGKKVAFANDANAAAFGEYWVGSGREHHSIVLLTLGTGVGGGIIIGDLSIDGEHSHGSECGHIIIDYNESARMCPCGQPGHLEAYASATSLLKRTEEALAEGRRSSIAARLEQGNELTPLLLAEEAERGDALGLELILETAMYLGVGITSLMHTIDPAAVILGGGMNFGGHETDLGRRFLGRIRQEVSRRAFPVPAQRTVIDFAGDAGYVGAAGIARVAHRRS
jgi:glucokinase